MVASRQSPQLSSDGGGGGVVEAGMDSEAARRQRMARYKEERRRQLAQQFGDRDRESGSGSTSSGGGGGGGAVRTTRASRLRSAATASAHAHAQQENGKTSIPVRRDSGVSEKKEINGRLGPDITKERSPLSDTTTTTSSSPGLRREKDKSAKRKSNLNRSINAEPTKDSPEDVLRRRRSMGITQSPAKTPTPRSTPTHTPATESDSSRRLVKRQTPPRESPKPRPRSSSGLLERRSSSPVASTAPDSPAAGAPTAAHSSTPPPLPDVVSHPSATAMVKPHGSILKKKSLDETYNAAAAALAAKPVGILKRKTSQEDGPSPSFASQPVTFSPTVLEPRRLGILKKHRSLDEGSSASGGMLTRRSASPDKPILKQQRRSSLEELRRRNSSPEPQSILKRRTSREEAVESSNTSEPQGILKRKISSGSSGPVHVTIAESVILAVAEKESLSDDTVKPILKKKTSLCDDPPGISIENIAQISDLPRPILKKKSSSETEDNEEKPKKPILKSRRNSGRVSESRLSFTDTETELNTREANGPAEFGERDAPSALSRSESSSPVRSLEVIRRIQRNIDPDLAQKRRSFDSWVKFKEENVDIQTPRTRTSFSVAERVINLEHFLASEVENQRPKSVSPVDVEEGKGALPKRTRDRERFRTQPITVQEIHDSRSWSRKEGLAMELTEDPACSPPPAHPLTRSDSVSNRASLFEAQLKRKEEEAKPKRILKGSAGRRVKLDPSRFQTQPVTQDEVEEAKKINEATNSSSVGDEEDEYDPSKLSLAERVKLFNQKMVSERLQPKTVNRANRYKTQPVTTEEVETAQKLAPISRTASSILVSGILKNLTEKNEGPKSRVKSSVTSESEDESESEPSSPYKKGILKSPTHKIHTVEKTEAKDNVNLKSVLKKENRKSSATANRQQDLHSILKAAKTDEGLTSDESETDSEEDKPNENSDLIDLLHKVEAQARGERRSMSPERRRSQILCNNKIPEEAVMNLKNLNQEKENQRVGRKFKKKKDESEDSSSSGGREIRKIIGNEAVARRRQSALAKESTDRAKRYSADAASLSKSRSHSAMNGEVVLRSPGHVHAHAEVNPLRRCLTQPMQPRDECDEPLTNGVSIAQRLEALHKRGQTDWKKRISRLNPEEELTSPISINAAAQVLQERLATPQRSASGDLPPPSTPLDERLGLLENSQQSWRRRVNPSDATQFSVAGKMGPVPVSPLASPALERRKKTPKPERFRSKGQQAKDVQSVPTSPEAEAAHAVFKRSISAPGGKEDNVSSANGDAVTGPLVSVPNAFDEDFTNFFASRATDERLELRDEDLETVTSSSAQLLVQRKTVKVQRRRGASSNPVKALAARTDLKSEYVEVKSGVAQREEKRLRVEKLAKNSNLAVEALAGLASQEDFASVQLKATSESTAHLSPMLPYKELMLLQIKGRRHVQTRLVRPHYTSVNQGDCYVMVTPTQVYQWVGQYSNVIEQSRSAEVAQHVVTSHDLGCLASVSQVTSLPGARCHSAFWRLLGADETTANSYTGAEAGHPDEDELYELTLSDTNMVYEVQGDELVPREDCWGAIPKIEILDHNNILVFDFGGELYVWMGKNVSLDRRRTALRLGQELWGQGFNYEDCDICPLTQFQYVGNSTDEQSAGTEKSSPARPEWALLAKVTQHMETVLFREKFSDWPDFSRVIQVKTKDKQTEASLEIKPCEAEPLVDWTPPEPDLELEGSHLGRGVKYYDAETHRHFEISTASVTVWHVQEFESTQLEGSSVGQLHSGDSYVVRWCYTVTVTGRELNGQPSRHSTLGRDRCCYWTWQGLNATTNDKGAAALLTVQLDQERGPQLRITEGQEPPAFRGLFTGGLVIHRGRRTDAKTRTDRWRLYLVSGEESREALLVEVPCSVRHLRSRACFVLLDTETGRLYLWRGTHSLSHTHQVALNAVEKLKENLPAEAGLQDVDDLQVKHISEGEEPKDFFDALGGHNRQLYESSDCLVNEQCSPRLFHLTSASGSFKATPVSPVCHHSEKTAPFPYTQQEIYSARQPALFLVDTGTSLWLWQGWWPLDPDTEVNAESTTSERDREEHNRRWQAERRAACHTALSYHHLAGERGRPLSEPRLVWAGLEPRSFTNAFPTWTDQDHITEINMREGRKPGECRLVEEELSRLERSRYPPATLLQRPLPDGVDPTRLEDYLAPNHFLEVVGVTKEEFADLPAWKQNKLKQDKGLF